MSYLFFLHIQCSMGQRENEIVYYVIFGKREELEQLPVCDPVYVLEDEEESVELRPIYFFWDRSDEKLVHLYERCEKERERAGGLKSYLLHSVSDFILNHMRNKYKEVFLSNPEALFLSEKAEKEMHPQLWKRPPAKQDRLHQIYGARQALEILEAHPKKIALFLALSKECRYERISQWLLEAERVGGEGMSDLFLFGEAHQKESSEEVLEIFYEETGLAGSFYPIHEYKKMLMSVSEETLLLDFYGMSMKEIGKPTFYIDGAGVRTRRENQRLKGVCNACKSLRNQLDRAFLSAL